MKERESTKEVEFDQLLREYKESSDEDRAQEMLNLLLLYARPVIEGILSGKFNCHVQLDKTSRFPEADAIYGIINNRLWQKLCSLKTAPQENHIDHYLAYVGAVANNAFRDYLREKNKQRRKLKDSLRYLLDGRNNKSPFVWWYDKDKRLLSGLVEWRDGKRPFVRTRHYLRLVEDPLDMMRTALSDEEASSRSLLDLMQAIYFWVDGPVQFDDLVMVIAELKGIKAEIFTHGEVVESGSDDTADDKRSLSAGESFLTRIPDPRPSTQERLERGELITAIWERILRLPPQGRLDFVLKKLDIIDEIMREGVATIYEVAAALEVSAEELGAVFDREAADKDGLNDEYLSEILKAPSTTIAVRRGRFRRKLAELLGLSPE